MTLLICHPKTPARGTRAIAVDANWVDCSLLELRFLVSGDSANLALPDIEASQRRDNLWRTTCFELFATLPTGYIEFNFSPSTHWAAYGFARYRDGMAPLAGIGTPEIYQDAGSDWYEFEVRLVIPQHEIIGKIAITAVIEETDGTKSYWALAHPSEKPDFHHPDGFVLQLPAPA